MLAHCTPRLTLAMAKAVPEYVKYTTKELNNYVNASGSCVNKISAILHINITPFGLNDFKKSLVHLISTKKIGSYDQKLKGIILDMRNTKVLPNSGAIRFDDPNIHIDISSDCYIFKPVVGSVVRGTVRHVSSAQIGVNIYRVFSVSIRPLNKTQIAIQVGSEIEFKIKKYCLESDFPYIEGELLEKSVVKEEQERSSKEIMDCKFLVRLLEDIDKDEMMEL